MKLKDGRITFLINRDNRTEIEITDALSNTIFCKIVLTNDQLTALLSRQGDVKCDITVAGLENVGKIHENKTFEFKITKELRSSDKSIALNQKCLRALLKANMTEWIPDNYYSSQNSFYEEAGEYFARVTIRRHVIDNNK